MIQRSNVRKLSKLRTEDDGRWSLAIRDFDGSVWMSAVVKDYQMPAREQELAD